MKNIALCFDRTGAGGTGNGAALADSLVSGDVQIVWSAGRTEHDGGVTMHPLRRRPAEREAARQAVTDAYRFLVEMWEPGDRLFMFGAGPAAFCARALTRLLGTVGVLRDGGPASGSIPDFREYVLSTYVLPRTRRDAADWQRVGALAAAFAGEQVSVAVDFLGLWDTVAVAGQPLPRAPEHLPNLSAARHAVAIDSGYQRGAHSLAQTSDAVQEVWFRGTHCDVAGKPGACAPLSDIALDWVLDGAVGAGLQVSLHRGPTPTAVDALSGTAHTVSLRRVPLDAAVHASVECYLRAEPAYWRRLPARFTWADRDWVARGERLVTVPRETAPVPAAAGEPALVVAS
ncbi:hypothetical protein Mycch_0871 [Mycolicibacterium chubuense NBB4]|uniref:T6SS Phospholipase effector Tle1-like catalytic domain-containing protein n=1 Tax=Mycolicibacterium chubuense (strain NBB4) TaxID=710421 RepID=I4BEH8_MYCCN|nr:DUF2235 domain-containing protein [Mycolicibacterium chubuense]AFM15685.1 hypothetical protein Mycch_0871 [Mycolicibacterium chubuense NBB4]